MSRHRRQASQALPPELFAGDDLTKPFDFTQSIAEEPGTARTTAVSHSQGSRIQSQQEIKEYPRTTTSPPKNKAPPPAKSA